MATEGQVGTDSLSDTIWRDCRFAYDASDNIEYIGRNELALAAEDATTWRVCKLTYAGGLLTRKQYAIGSWTGRPALAWI